MAKPASPSSVQKNLLSVRRSLSDLDRSLARLVAALNGSGTAPASAPTARRPRSKQKLSLKRRATLKLQGRYMGYMRQLKPKQNAEVRTVKEKRGFEAAIKRAKVLVGKRKAA